MITEGIFLVFVAHSGAGDTVQDKVLRHQCVTVLAHTLQRYTHTYIQAYTLSGRSYSYRPPEEGATGGLTVGPLSSRSHMYFYPLILWSCGQRSLKAISSASFTLAASKSESAAIYTITVQVACISSCESDALSAWSGPHAVPLLLHLASRRTIDIGGHRKNDDVS